MDHTFFNRAMSAIANLGLTKEKCDTTWKTSLDLYKRLLPDDYQPVIRKPYMTQMFVEMAKTTSINFATSIKVTFSGRLARWIRLQMCYSGVPYLEGLKDGRI
jgi:hypothetical protein